MGRWCCHFPVAYLCPHWILILLQLPSWQWLHLLYWPPFLSQCDIPSWCSMALHWKEKTEFCLLHQICWFLWEISSHQVSLTDKKCTKLLGKLNGFPFASSPYGISLKMHIITWLPTRLQHITFVYRDGHSVLPLLSTFISKFRNDHSCLHIPGSVLNCAQWWQAILLTPGTSRSLAAQCWLDPDIWVDTSMSWGVGIVVCDRWAAWKLIEGWKCKDHDISWA